MREKLLTFADVMIRVPPLFIIDELLRIGLGLSNDNVVLYSTERGFKISRVSDSIVNSIIPTSLLQPFDFEYFAYKMHFIMALKFLCCCLGKILYTFSQILECNVFYCLSKDLKFNNFILLENDEIFCIRLNEK